MLVRGNSKLGKEIWQWSIPAAKTCPGRSELCESRCYALKGFFTMPNVKASLERNLEASKLGDFVERVVEQIHKKNIRTVRLHVSGDIYSVAYAKKLYDIMQQCPDTRFFMYTRSWRKPEFLPIFKKMARLKNLRFWWSIDTETGTPKQVPKRVRLAYMSVALDDIPPEKADLVFRDYPVRGVVQKYINGVLVCPPENGVNKLTCEQCGICHRKTETPKRESEVKTPGRYALTLT